MIKLDLRDYPIGLLESIINTNGKEATDRKLTSYGYGFTSNGSGRKRIYTISSLPNSFQQFKSFCVFSLGFSPQTDFVKLRNFLFYFLGNDDFSWRPHEMMEAYLRSEGKGITRQTITTYHKKLEQLELVASVGDFVYYRVRKDCGVQVNEIITKEEYNAAWASYFQWRNSYPDADSRPAYTHMYNEFGGVPRKHIKVEKNGIYIDELNYLFDLVSNSIMEEVSGQCVILARDFLVRVLTAYYKELYIVLIL